jgi:hypothetical protein
MVGTKSPCPSSIVGELGVPMTPESIIDGTATITDLAGNRISGRITRSRKPCADTRKDYGHSQP